MQPLHGRLCRAEMGLLGTQRTRNPDIWGFGLPGPERHHSTLHITGNLHLCALSQPIHRRIRSLAGKCAAHADDARVPTVPLLQ